MKFRDFRLGNAAARREYRTFGDEAELLHPLQALFADLVPALLIDRHVLRNVFGGCLQREVWCLVGKVQKPGAGRLLTCALDEVDGVIGDGIRGVESAFTLQLWSGGETRHHPLVPGVDAIARVEAVKIIEAARGGIEVAYVPLATRKGMVTRWSQHFTERDALVVQTTAIARGLDSFVARAWKRSSAIRSHEANACLMRIQASQQGGARRTATCTVVKLGEAQPVGGQRIQMRRLDFATVATQV